MCICSDYLDYRPNYCCGQNYIKICEFEIISLQNYADIYRNM